MNNTKPTIRAALYCVFAGVFWATGAAAAPNGQVISTISLAATKQNIIPHTPWLDFASRMSIFKNDDAMIHAADGREYMKVPTQAESQDGLVHDYIDKFYRPDLPRVHLVVHYAGRKPGEIISFGLDSGHHAEKLTIAPALFLGYARTRQFAANKSGVKNYLTIAGGGWFAGGNIKHKPCTDSTGREFYCGTTGPWVDYASFINRDPQLDYYAHLRFTREF